MFFWRKIRLKSEWWNFMFQVYNNYLKIAPPYNCTRLFYYYLFVSSLFVSFSYSLESMNSTIVLPNSYLFLFFTKRARIVERKILKYILRILQLYTNRSTNNVVGSRFIIILNASWPQDFFNRFLYYRSIDTNSYSIKIILLARAGLAWREC